MMRLLNSSPHRQRCEIVDNQLRARRLLPLMMSLVGLLGVFFSILPDGHATIPKNVLVINAYHTGYRWSDRVVAGIRDTLLAAAPQTQLYVEHLDSKRFYSPAAFNRLADLIREKYHRIVFDAVIAADNNSISFLKQHRHSLFAGIPAVFCGANDLNPADLDGMDPITGVNEAADVRETIELALHLRPSTRRMVVVNDTTPTGRNVNREIKRIASSFTDRLTFVYWDDLGRQDLLRQLASLKNGDTVLFTFFFRDHTGRFYEYDDSAQHICSASPVPVLGLWEFNLGHGIVGGKLVSGFAQGQAAGKMALRILDGETAETIPLLMESPNRFAFDFNVMKKFGINESELPPDSLIINRPRSLYEEYKPEVWAGIMAIVSMAMLILFLLVNIDKRRKMERALRESRLSLKRITDNLPAVVYQFYATADNRYGLNYVSDKAFEIFEMTAAPETFFEAFSACVHKDDRERFFRSIADAAATMRSWDFEGRFVKPAGEIMWFSGNSIPHKQQDRIVFDGVLADITEAKLTEEKLRRSERQMSQIINFLPDPTFVIDHQSRVIAWSRAMEELTGVDAQAMLGKGDYEYATVFYNERRPIMIDLVGHWDDGIARKYQGITKKGEILVSETVESHRPFGDRHFKNTAGPLYDENGAVVGAIETIHDITERRATEKALSESETLLRLFVEYTPAAVAMCDTEMNYLAYSRRWIIDYHLPDEDLKGRCHYDVFEVIPEHWKEQHQRCFKGEVIENEEEPFTRADGTLDWVRRSLHPWRTPVGQIGGLILFTEVVTHKKRAEESLRLMELVLENSPAVLFRWEAAEGWPVSYVSENISQFGYTTDDFLVAGKPYAAIIHPEDLDAVIEQTTSDSRLAASHDQLEYRIVTKDGRIRWVDDRTMFEKDETGNITHYQGVLMDITERKKAQEEVHKRQLFLESVLYHAPDAVITLDARHRVIDWNPGAEKIFGYTREEALGHELDNLVSVDDARSEAGQKTSSVLSGNRVEAFETVRYRKNGTPIHVIAAGSPIMVDGTLKAVVAMYTDVTALKQAENESRRNERMLRRIMDMVPSMIFVKNARGRFLMANQAVADSYGLTVEEMVGKCQTEVHPDPDQAKQYLAADKKAIESGAPQYIHEEPYLDASGITRWLEVTKLPCDILDFGESAIVGLATDITERKQTAEELQQLRNYLSNIINSMPSVLVGVDTEGRVTQWNRQAERMTGMTFDKVRSQPLTTVFPQLMDKMDRIQTAIRDRRVIRDPKIHRQNQDESRFEDVTIFPLVANGIEGAVIRVDDVTDRVRMEEMMIQSEKMLSVGGLAAGMAHEINNPLAGILQNTAVLNNRLFGDLPANRKAAEAAGTTMPTILRYLELRKMHTMLDNIHTSGKRAAAIVKNMLSFARKSDRIISSHDLRSLLDQTIELAQADYNMKKRYDFKHIHIVREYDDTVGPVPCEGSKIQQVFLNILKNGAEAMALVKEGRPQPMFILRVKEGDSWVRVEIEDNGPGIDEKTRRRIFEPFFTTKPVGEGTGLGLSVSYFIITENHGGKMTVNAAEGRGTRFVIRLPKTGKQ